MDVGEALRVLEAEPGGDALGRADALFAELPGDARAALGHEIAQFKAALDTQDPKQIDAARERLVAATAQLGRGAG